MNRCFFGAALLATLLLSACGAAPEAPTSLPSNPQPSPSEAAAPPSPEPPAALDPTTATQSATLSLDAFTSIEIDVLAADIQVTTGDDWSISYSLSDKEPVRQVGVINNTLYLDTRFDPTERLSRRDDWFVNITIPKDAVLSEVELETLSGHVDVQTLTCDSASFSSASGDVSVQSVDARELDVESISGAVSVSTVSATSLEAQTTSGDISVDGSFGELESSTVSGRTDVAASLSAQGELESVSGDIVLALDSAASLKAASVGGITLNGETALNPLNTTGGIPVSLQSVSGKLNIQTP